MLNHYPKARVCPDKGGRAMLGDTVNLCFREEMDQSGLR